MVGTGKDKQDMKERYILYNFIVAYDGERDTSKPTGWIQQVGNDWYASGEGTGMLLALVDGKMPFDKPDYIHSELNHCYSGFYRTYDLIPPQDISDAEVKVTPDNVVHELCGTTQKGNA